MPSCGARMIWWHVVLWLSTLWAEVSAAPQVIEHNQCVTLTSWSPAARALGVPPCIQPATLCTSCSGLTTDARGNILGLNLSGYQLANNTLPTQWSELTNLQELDLSNTRVAGPLPIEWSVLGGLTKMDLSYNQLNGALVDQWSMLTNLQILRMSNNRLSGTLPSQWSTLIGLRVLDVSFNTYPTGVLPSVWSTLSLLKQLWLSANALTGSLPAEWSTFEQLAGIYLCGNKLSGSLPSQWSTLRSLNTWLSHSNRLSGPIPSTWAGAMPNMTVMQLDNNALTGPIPAGWFINMPYLQWFSISRNHLTGSIPPLPTSSSIAVLDVQNNSLTGQLSNIDAQHAPNLVAFRVGYNRFSSGLPKLPPNLIYLDASYNSLTGGISGLPDSIKYFNVESNRLTSVDALFAPNVSFISLAQNSFTQKLPRPLSSSLTVLNVSNNQFDGPIPPSWADTNCVVLDISNNHLDGPIPANLTATMFVASNNTLTGTLPEHWPLEPPISVLDLQNNSLKGRLPGRWFNKGTMAALQYVGLADNKFVGGVPLEWVRNTTGENHAKLVVGNALWWQNKKRGIKTWLSVSSDSGWLKAVCTNEQIYSRILPSLSDIPEFQGVVDMVNTNVKSLANSSVLRVEAVEAGDVKLSAIVVQMYLQWGSIMVGPYFKSIETRKDNLDTRGLCSNGKMSLPLVAGLWSVVLVGVVVIAIFYAYLHPYVRNVSDARGLNWFARLGVMLRSRQTSGDLPLMVRLLYLGCMAVYWGDIITDLLVVISIWGYNWPCYVLIVILVGHYVYSAIVLSLRWASLKDTSTVRVILLLPITVVCIPLLDTLAFADAAGVPMSWLAGVFGEELNMERYHDGRALLETLLESVPSCVVQSVIFVLGNSPKHPLFVDSKVFILSILFSGLRTVTTTVIVMWEALFDRHGLGRYISGLLVGEGLFPEGSEGPNPPSGVVTAQWHPSQRESVRPVERRKELPLTTSARAGRRDFIQSGLQDL